MTETPTRPRSRAATNSRGTTSLFSRLSVPAAIIALLIIGTAVSDSFLTTSNLLNVVNANAAVGLAALGMTFVAVCGGMADLSVPASVALGALITLGMQPSLGVVGAAVFAVFVATVGGVVNGVLIGYMKINPIIATLGTGAVFLGLSQLLVGGGIVYGEDNAVADFVRGSVWHIPVRIWIFLIFAAILAPLLARTPFGRWSYAVGGNYEAAEASAVPVKFTKAMAFVMTGVLAGLCGMLLALSNGQARPIIGVNYEFVAITAVVIGGTSLFGGNGSILRTVGGVIITALIGNLIIFIGLPTQATGLITGLILVIAVGIDVYFRRKAGRA